MAKQPVKLRDLTVRSEPDEYLPTILTYVYLEHDGRVIGETSTSSDPKAIELAGAKLRYGYVHLPLPKRFDPNGWKRRKRRSTNRRKRK